MVYNFKKFNEKVTSFLRHLESEIVSLRTGRASPALLENIQVRAYGTLNPLKNVASIVVDDPRTLSVEPWDKSLLEAILKAIEVSSLGVRPIPFKNSLRVSLPPLTAERREALLKILKEKLEESRISLRQARDEVWKDIQEKERRGIISEDDKFRFKNEMEELVKKGGEKLEEISRKKEKEIKE